MPRYRVIYEQTEQFAMEVEAENREQADDLASEMFSSGDYEELGVLQIETSEIKEI